MKNEGLSPNGLIIMGVVCIVIGIFMLADLADQTRLKLILASFAVPALGIIALIVGLFRKFRKPNGGKPGR